MASMWPHQVLFMMMVLKPTTALQTSHKSVSTSSTLTNSTTDPGACVWKLGDEGVTNCNDVCGALSLECGQSAFVVQSRDDVRELVQGLQGHVSCDYIYTYQYYYVPFLQKTDFGQQKCVGTNDRGRKGKCALPNPNSMHETIQRLCPCCPCSETSTSSICTIFEDPHINTFDKLQVSLLGNSDTSSVKWLVKTGQVHIQARFVENVRGSFMSAIAVGGAMIKGNCAVIPSLANDITWNSGAILTNQTSTFKFDGGDYVVDFNRSEHASLVTDLSKAHPGVEIQFPLGVSLIVNRLHDHVNAAIKMTQQKDDQEGLCGNFNGIAVDDALELSSKRSDASVPEEESLFQGVALQ